MEFIKRNRVNLLFIVMMCFLTGCATTKQMLSIERGMTKQEVRTLMGEAGNRQFFENIEIWQYCSISPNPIIILSLGTIAVTNYKVILFKDSTVEGVSTYSKESHCQYETVSPSTMTQHSQTSTEQHSPTGTKQQQTSTYQQQMKMQETIRQEKIRQQILNHGAGGCTPDFATGGCL